MDKSAGQKNERPVGVPAALAWGWRDLIGSSILLWGGWLFDCARKQKNNAQEQDRYDHSATPEAEPNYRRRKRVCGKRLKASLAWKVHLRQYCLLALPYLPPLDSAKSEGAGNLACARTVSHFGFLGQHHALYWDLAAMGAIKYAPQGQIVGSVLELMLGPRSHEQEVA